ncbi:hypothetical protein SOHN41_01307 [Shewanella sp. HN-41]|nr:hypothetical protein SOHN41_01307 [Shewanella sp. HN-41]
MHTNIKSRAAYLKHLILHKKTPCRLTDMAFLGVLLDK